MERKSCFARSGFLTVNETPAAWMFCALSPADLQSVVGGIRDSNIQAKGSSNVPSFSDFIGLSGLSCGIGVGVF